MYDQDLPSVIESSGKSRDEHKITFYRLSTGWYFTELEDEDGEVFSLEEINRDQRNFLKRLLDLAMTLTIQYLQTQAPE